MATGKEATIHTLNKDPMSFDPDEIAFVRDASGAVRRVKRYGTAKKSVGDRKKIMRWITYAERVEATFVFNDPLLGIIGKEPLDFRGANDHRRKRTRYETILGACPDSICCGGGECDRISQISGQTSRDDTAFHGNC